MTEVSDEVKAEIEQNANLVYEETRDFVCELNPSLTAVTIAFDMLLREAVRDLVMADWSDSEQAQFGGTVDFILAMKYKEVFAEVAAQAEALVKPPISKDAFLVDGSELVN